MLPVALGKESCNEIFAEVTMNNVARVVFVLTLMALLMYRVFA